MYLLRLDDSIVGDTEQETLSRGPPWRYADGIIAIRHLCNGDDGQILAALRALLTYTRANVRNLAVEASLACGSPDVAAEFSAAAINDVSVGVVGTGLQAIYRIFLTLFLPLSAVHSGAFSITEEHSEAVKSATSTRKRR